MKKRRQIVMFVSLINAAAFLVVLCGCADTYYATNRVRAPEAKFNTYYAPDYYPYYPWDGYYGGAYYYGE